MFVDFPPNIPVMGSEIRGQTSEIRGLRKSTTDSNRSKSSSVPIEVVGRLGKAGRPTCKVDGKGRILTSMASNISKFFFKFELD